MKWKKANTPPNNDRDVLLQVTAIHSGEEDICFCTGYYVNGEYEITPPVIFDYPCNYWEGSKKVTHWMELPDKAID